MGLCAFAVDLALELLNSWKFTSVKSAIAYTNSFWPPYLAFLFFNMGFSCLSGCLVSFAAPLAAGSGIPEVKAYLNGVRIRGSPPALPTLSEQSTIAFRNIQHFFWFSEAELLFRGMGIQSCEIGTHPPQVPFWIT